MHSLRREGSNYFGPHPVATWGGGAHLIADWLGLPTVSRVEELESREELQGQSRSLRAATG